MSLMLPQSYNSFHKNQNLFPYKINSLYMDVTSFIEKVYSNYEIDKNEQLFVIFKKTWKNQNFSKIHLALCNQENIEILNGAHKK